MKLKNKFKIKYVDPKGLVPYKRNTKLHPESQLNKLTQAFIEFDFDVPIVVDENNVIIKGHARREAAIKQKIELVPVIVRSDLDGTLKRAAAISDNKLAESDWDLDNLKFELQELESLKFDLELTGFDLQEIEKIGLNELNEDQGVKEGLTDDDEVPEKVESVCKEGDLWQLGEHRLLCGDCTKKKNVERLINSKKIDMVFTDPPYGVDYSGKNEFLNAIDGRKRIQKEIKNDSIDDYVGFFSDFLAVIPLNDYNSIYVCMSGQELHSLRIASEAVGYKWGAYIIWAKNCHVLGRKDYNGKHEFIYYGWKEKHKFYGGFDTTVWEIPKPQKSELHPTMKPIELITRAINNSSKASMIVYDPFGGSGSTLIACEKTKRVCYMMEIDPHYCDVIIKRWEDFTGRKAELIKKI